jgi:hypothetical protein
MLERLTSSHEQYIQLVRSAPDARLLPENPSRMTFRGRYAHVEKFLADTIFSHIPQGTQIRVLDFGAGVLETGSPTDHDTHDMLTSCGHTPHIIAVDPFMPESLHPLYLDILYTKSLPEDDTPVHIVKLLHVQEHLGSTLYQSIRSELLKRLTDGGLFITTNSFYRSRWDLYGEDHLQLPTLLKVLQKRGEQCIPLALLPDCMIPYGFSSWGLSMDPEENKQERQTYLSGYEQFRQEVLRGEIELPVELKMYEYGRIVSKVEGGSLPEWDLATDEYTDATYGYSHKALEEMMNRNGLDAHRFFVQGLKE